MLTGQAEENLDMMFTKLLTQEDINMKSVACRLTVPHTLQSLSTINQLLISTVY
jgi:hypothetical protein